MKKSVVVSIRIPEKLKKELEKYKINPKEAFYLGAELLINKEKSKEEDISIKKYYEKMKDKFKKITTEDIVKSIREDRGEI